MSDAWFKFYPSDWLAGTRGLTMAEAGLYVTLTAMMYERGGPVDMEPGRLARLCGATPAAFKKALASLVDCGKIIETEGGLWSSRVQKELKKRAVKREKASQSASARWEKEQQKQLPSDASAGETHSNDDATRKPESQRPEYTTLNAREVSDALFEAAGDAMADPARSPGVMVMSEPLSWLRSGADPELDILPTIRAKAANRPPGSVGSWAYFTAAIMDAKARREREHQTPEISDDQPSRQAKHQSAAERGRAASQQRKSAWLDAVAELDGGAGGHERPERPRGDHGGHGRIAPIARTG